MLPVTRTKNEEGDMLGLATAALDNGMDDEEVTKLVKESER
jgi:hypothetical protein